MSRQVLARSLQSGPVVRVVVREIVPGRGDLLVNLSQGT